MTPERILLAVLTASVAFLGWQAKRIVLEDERDRQDWRKAMRAWDRDRRIEQALEPLT